MNSILFVNTNMCAGGIEVSLLTILQKLDYQRFKVTVLLCGSCLDFISRIPEKCEVLYTSENDNQILIRVNQQISHLYSKRRNVAEKALLRVLLKWKDTLYLNTITKKMKGYSFDTAIAFRAGFVAKLVARGIKAKKKILFDHSGSYDKTFRDIKVCGQFDELITVSEGKRKLNVQECQTTGERFRVVHNLVNVEGIKRLANTSGGVFSIMDIYLSQLEDCVRIRGLIC